MPLCPYVRDETYFCPHAVSIQIISKAHSSAQGARSLKTFYLFVNVGFLCGTNTESSFICERKSVHVNISRQAKRLNKELEITLPTMSLRWIGTAPAPILPCWLQAPWQSMNVLPIPHPSPSHFLNGLYRKCCVSICSCVTNSVAFLFTPQAKGKKNQNNTNPAMLVANTIAINGCPSRRPLIFAWVFIVSTIFQCVHVYRVACFLIHIVGQTYTTGRE